MSAMLPTETSAAAPVANGFVDVIAGSVGGALVLLCVVAYCVAWVKRIRAERDERRNASDRRGSDPSGRTESDRSNANQTHTHTGRTQTRCSEQYQIGTLPDLKDKGPDQDRRGQPNSIYHRPSFAAG